MSISNGRTRGGGNCCPVIIYGATGATGPSGSDITVSPPRIIFGPTASTSTSAYIYWTYPTQTPSGFMSEYLPYILSYNSNLVTTTGGATGIQTSNTSTGLNKYINNNGVGSIVGLILTYDSTYSGDPVATVTFPNSLGTFISQYKYIPSLQSILADGSGNVFAWYAN